MDSIGFDSVGVEKANAMRRHRTLRKFANFLRVLEVSVALFIMLVWSSKKVSDAGKIFIRYLRELCVVLTTPPFMFLIGNAIIITLFVKSGHFSGEHPDRDNAEPDLHDEYIQQSNRGQKVVSQTDSLAAKVTHDDESVKNSESQQKDLSETDSTVPVTSVDKQIVFWENAAPPPAGKTKLYRRTKSATIQHETAEKPSRELRRSETEKFQKRDGSWRRLSTVDELSSEEFRQKVEEFIAKQQRLLREEYVAIVNSNQT